MFFSLASSSSIPVSSSTNIARNKTTWGSSYYVDGYGTHYAYMAVDCSRALNLKCFYSGDYDANPWWAVDLDSLTDVFGAALTNRDSSGKIKYIHLLILLENHLIA